MCEEHNIPKVYDPASVEKKWYKFWEEHRYFHAEVEEGKEAFSIVIPPPNITGQLHMGHALDETMQDILIRFWQCECYGQIVEWLSNDMKYDIQAQFSRLCTFYRGGFEAMARQDADTGIPC